jgi:hypothetical protein
VDEPPPAGICVPSLRREEFGAKSGMGEYEDRCGWGICMSSM